MVGVWGQFHSKEEKQDFHTLHLGASKRILVACVLSSGCLGKRLVP